MSKPWMELARALRNREEEIRASLPPWTGSNAEAIAEIRRIAGSDATACASGARRSLAPFCESLPDDALLRLLNDFRVIDACDKDKRYSAISEALRLVVTDA